MKPDFSYRAIPLRVLDGDTIQVKLTLWLNLTLETTVRLHGINTPEVRGPTQDKGLVSAKALALKLDLDYPTKEKGQGKPVTLKVLGIEKYGRTLGKLFLGDLDLGDWLVKEGLAVPYMADREILPEDPFLSQEEP